MALIKVVREVKLLYGLSEVRLNKVTVARKLEVSTSQIALSKVLEIGTLPDVAPWLLFSDGSEVTFSNGSKILVT